MTSLKENIVEDDISSTDSSIDINGNIPTIKKGKELENGSISIDSQEDSTHWRSILISVVVAFLIGVEFSIYFSSIWPFLKSVSLELPRNQKCTPSPQKEKALSQTPCIPQLPLILATLSYSSSTPDTFYDDIVALSWILAIRLMILDRNLLKVYVAYL
jgi:hypothetical protein